MPETIEKLSPHRDLQCYFYDQSAIAALSETSADGFTLSGTWRQQFDWAVVEWNRDNVFEHPAFRTLPDGDLSGLTLTYDETRENCIPLDSDLSPTVDWPYLRIWVRENDQDEVYFVSLKDYATPLEGEYVSAYADFTLSGSSDSDQLVGLSYTGNSGSVNLGYEIHPGDNLGSVASVFAGLINDNHSLVRAEQIGSTSTIRMSYTAGAELTDSKAGANGNRFGMFAWAAPGAVTWGSSGKTFANGTSPGKWRVTLDFSNLMGRTKNLAGQFQDPVRVPTTNVRKLRWTYAADLQAGEFVRNEFKAVISNWTVTGTGRTYSIAGTGSRRIEDNDAGAIYNVEWLKDQGNYSGGTIRYTTRQHDSVTVTYIASGTHTLYVGTRYLNNGAWAAFEVDSVAAGCLNLHVPLEDVLVRWRLGTFGGGTHTITMKHDGPDGSRIDFDFIELAIPTEELPTFPEIPGITLATDWDTLHSVAISPERTAWMIRSMGFTGRQNHYVGALLFYEMYNPANRYATSTITFSGTAEYAKKVWVEIGPSLGSVRIERLMQMGETLETVVLSFLQEFNKGYTTFWAEASGGALTIHSRLLGHDGEDFTVAAGTESTTLSVSVSSGVLTGAVDGEWRTDLTATPRLNRAMRDWTRSFLAALHGYGIDAACAFSTELKHGDPSPEAGIAQRDSANNSIELPTPAIQTNFSPTSLAFWKQVYADCAQIMDEAGLVPFLQFGEEQWWYFLDDGTAAPGHTFSSLPFYDAWTTAEFESRYGRSMTEFTTRDLQPTDYPDEVEFLSAVLGDFTTSVMEYVRVSYSSARFEVLYPFDVNDTEFMKAVNYPAAAWTPTGLTSLKTEGLRYTFSKDLRKSEQGLDIGVPLGFNPEQRSHLTGLGDYTAPWLKEARIALGKGFESVVLFALDQFCLIGYELPLRRSGRRTVRVRR